MKRDWRALAALGALAGFCIALREWNGSYWRWWTDLNTLKTRELYEKYGFDPSTCPDGIAFGLGCVPDHPNDWVMWIAAALFFALAGLLIWIWWKPRA